MSGRWNKSAPIHKESLLNIPIVKMALEDLTSSRHGICRRAVDKTWSYEGIVPISVTGFNPFGSQAYIGQKSHINNWLKNPGSSARKNNHFDLLVPEVLFLAHDYLHIWAFRMIQEIMPRLKYGVQPINASNFEDFVFCHLLTEAAAVVGLDYWLLSCEDVNSYCPIGSNVNSLAVSYSEGNIDEYRKFHPDFEAQAPRFFEEIATFYCSGEFHGFDINDLKRSPMLLSWLEHELNYGETQRVYTRSFLSRLSNRKVSLSKKALSSPVAIHSQWQKLLMEILGVELWEKVKYNKPSQISLKPDFKHWKSDGGELDFGYFNLNNFEGSERQLYQLLGQTSEMSKSYFLYQLISSYPYKSFDSQELRVIRDFVDREDLQAARVFFRGRKKIKKSTREPSDIMIVN